MSWTAPSTFVAGSVLTAAALNTNVRDNTQYLYNGRPRCQAFHSTTQSHGTSGTWIAVTFNSEDHDTGAMHDTSSNPTRFTIPANETGIYWIAAGVKFANGAGSVRGLRLRKNGTTIIGTATNSQTVGASGVTNVPNATLASLTAADYVEVLAIQDSGGALNMGDATNRDDQNQFSIFRVQ